MFTNAKLWRKPSFIVLVCRLSLPTSTYCQEQNKMLSTLKFFVFHRHTFLLTNLMQFGSFPTFIDLCVLSWIFELCIISHIDSTWTFRYQLGLSNFLHHHVQILCACMAATFDFSCHDGNTRDWKRKTAICIVATHFTQDCLWLYDCVTLDVLEKSRNTNLQQNCLKIPAAHWSVSFQLTAPSPFVSPLVVTLILDVVCPQHELHNFYWYFPTFY